MIRKPGKSGRRTDDRLEGTMNFGSKPNGIARAEIKEIPKRYLGRTQRGLPAIALSNFTTLRTGRSDPGQIDPGLRRARRGLWLSIGGEPEANRW
jgi:hypothetical protein